MANTKIPKYSSVRWAAFSVGAVILGYIIGIYSVSRNNLSDGDTYMIMIYSEITYDDIYTWAEGLEDISMTGSGVFPTAGSGTTDDSPRAFVLIEAPTRQAAQEVASTCPGYNDRTQIKTIKKQE